MGWEKFQATVYAEEGIWLEDEFCRDVVRIYRGDVPRDSQAMEGDGRGFDCCCAKGR
jgi:hypothetical protein